MNLGGSAKLLKARPVQGTDWLLVVALDKAEATTGLQSVLKTLAIAIVLLACLATAVAAALTAQSFRRLSQVRDAMDKIGSGGGDLTQRLPVSGRDEVAQIASSFNGFVEQIGTVLKDVRNGVESMKTATDEIKLGNLDLSNRTESSASSLQETSASLSQLTANVRQSAEAAAMATRLAQSASSSATKGGDVVGSAVSTMDDISKASSKIGEIIGVIDAIAFQTNILALNAAVEAARAGEQGRGFAVVAAEVRSLAHRSAAAAKEIKTLIDASGASVAMGTDRVRAAGQTMGEIVDGIQRVSQIIVEINGAMTEQSVGIGQINQAVADMDRATQQNAALVEESTAASSRAQRAGPPPVAHGGRLHAGRACARPGPAAAHQLSRSKRRAQAWAGAPRRWDRLRAWACSSRAGRPCRSRSSVAEGPMAAMASTSWPKPSNTGTASALTPDSSWFSTRLRRLARMAASSFAKAGSSRLWPSASSRGAMRPGSPKAAKIFPVAVWRSDAGVPWRMAT